MSLDLRTVTEREVSSPDAEVVGCESFGVYCAG